jgi:hypothetical protein
MAESSGDTGTRPWHWEGHVQDMLRRHLVAGGWTVKSAANTESREPGIDLVATKDGRWLAIEVKGYPTNVYDHGAKRGQPKPTQPTNQARQWFSHALLAAMLLRHKRPDAEIALCFPDFQTYRTLASRTRRSFVLLGFGRPPAPAGGSVGRGAGGPRHLAQRQSIDAIQAVEASRGREPEPDHRRGSLVRFVKRHFPGIGRSRFRI